MQLTKRNWPRGWNPSSDAINGDPEGLLRADNLRLDKEGVLGLIDGFQQLAASYSDFISNIYTKIVNGKEYVWVAAGFPASSILRTLGGFGVADKSLVVSQSPSDKCGFGDGLGNIYAVAGALRTKDPITSNPLQLGLLTPRFGPQVFINNQDSLAIAAPTNVIDGTLVSGSTFTVNTSTLNGTIVSLNNFLYNTLDIGGVGAANDPNNDIIQIAVTIINKPSTIVDIVQLDLLLDGTLSDPSTYNNFYSYEFNPFYYPGGFNSKVTFSARRGDFSRTGNDQYLDWSKVIGVRVVIKSKETVDCKISEITFFGGSQGGLNGVYNFAQVNVANNGIYLAKSPLSDASQNPDTGSDNFPLINGSVRLSPFGPDPNATEYWFFIKGASNAGVDPNTGEAINQSFLNQWYFIGKSTQSDPNFTYGGSDEDTLQLNADGSLLPNLFLLSLNFDDHIHGLRDSIFAAEGLFNERMLYLSSKYLYLSDRLNPDAVDQRFTIKASGDNTEENLWIKKLTNNVYILATTKDLYEISGTLLEQPDGTLDIRVVGLGESHPPLSIDVTNFNGGLYYIASDGLRVTTGSNSVNVSPQLRHLFQSNVILANSNQTRHGVPGVSIFSNQNVDYSIASSHNKVYFVCPLQDGTRRIFYFDTVTKNYGLIFSDPVKIFSTQADELIAGFGASSGNAIYLLDYEAGWGFNSTQGLPITFRTVFDANNQPRNRKDTFTLKLVLDTGGRDVNVQIQKDGVGVTEFDEFEWIDLGAFSSDGQGTIYIPLDAVTLGFRYAIQITDANGLYKFKLYELTIEYEPRPEQLNYMRILPNNLGTISRKRLTSFAFIIDTLGNDVTFTPNLDNTPWATSKIVNTTNKLTFIFFFQSEAIAIDIGGILVGGPFEFYGIHLEESVSEKLPVPLKYLIIPNNDYGTPNRKRHTSYKFQINTLGKNVRFTPNLDTVPFPPQTYTTTQKRTVEYYFGLTDGSSGDVIAIDIGGTLESIEDEFFEYYGTIVPQKVEVLPDRLKYLKIPNSNLGVAAPKRIRTLPLVLDTFGYRVEYTSIVDNAVGATSLFTTSGRQTVLHYFQNDVFGIDFGGILRSFDNQPFEFYEMGNPEDIEVLPVSKKYDQIGPFRLDKIGKFFGFRLRLIMTGNTTSMPYKIYGEDSLSVPGFAAPLYESNFNVYPGIDEIYEVQFPKNVNTSILRLVLGPTNDHFHRYNAFFKVQTSGMESDSKWQPIR